jgi:hypothetical protein
MVNECKEVGAMPVVLSPFVCGSRYTTRGAINYARALGDLAKPQSFLFIDCIRELRSRAKRQILQHDGFHLSRLGQGIVGEAIASSIVGHALKAESGKGCFMMQRA